MKNITSQFAAKLQLDLTAVATCWTILRRDGAVFAFTDWDSDLLMLPTIRTAAENWVSNYAGTYGYFPPGSPNFKLRYLASSGFSKTNLAEVADLGKAANVQIDGALDATIITDVSIRNRLWDYAMVLVTMVHWPELIGGGAVGASSGDMRMFTGQFGPLTLKEYGWSVELRGLSEFLNREIGDLYSPTCRVDLGSPQCGINLPSITVTGTVVSSDGSRTMNANVGTPPAINAGTGTTTTGSGTTAPNHITFQGVVTANFYPHQDNRFAGQCELRNPSDWDAGDQNFNPGSSLFPLLASVTGNSLLFNPPWPPNPVLYAASCDQSPLIWAVVDGSGNWMTQVGDPNGNLFSKVNYQPTWTGATQGYCMIVVCTLYFPVSGTHTVRIVHDDGIFWGLGNGATRVSGPSNCPAPFATKTPLMGYNVMGANNVDGGADDSWTVNIPVAGAYPLEIAYTNAVGGQTLQVYIDGTTPYGQYSSVTAGTQTGSNNTFFDGGLLTWLTGQNAGFSIDVKKWNPSSTSTTTGQNGGNLVLFSKSTYPIQPGDTFMLSPGCDKLFATCKNKFFNQLNFQGENTVPSPDHILDYPDLKIHS